MKRLLLRLILCLTLCAVVCKALATDTASDKEIRAVWLTTINGLDWPRTPAKSERDVEHQKRELTEILDRLQKIRINTVLLQTRIRGTVIYPSRLEPWDGCMSGRPGGYPGYDPLRFALEECHKRGMELHAWVVTMPLGHWNGTGCRNARRNYSAAVKRIGQDGFLNPESPQTGDIIAGICAEIARNYDVDGIHLDYIRYPDGWKMKVSRSAGRAYITDIVRKVNRAVKAIRPEIKLSCAPIGKHNDLRRYSSRGWNAYQTACQDAQGWLRSGLMDQLYPMMYFRENQFFPFAIDWAENRNGRDIAAGLAVYLLDRREGNWRFEEVERQLAVCRQLGLGQCFFRVRFLLDNVQGIYDYLHIWNNQDLWPSYQRYANMKTVLPDDGKDCIERRMEADAPSPLPFFKNDGRLMYATFDAAGFDADFLLLESLTGVTVATMPHLNGCADVSSVNPGTYVVRSLGKKGVSHRLGYVEIKR